MSAQAAPCAAQLDQLREWVLAHNPDLDPADLSDETPLLATRLVTSLQVTELLLLIEQLRQAPLDLTALTPGAFQDLRTIRQRFLGAGEPQERS